MRLVIACLMMAAHAAWAQSSAPTAPTTGSTPQPTKTAPGKAPVAPKATPAAKAAPQLCADCAEIRSIRQVTKELPQTELAQQQPTGLVASVPLGGGKSQIGSSTRYGQEATRTSTQWEVTLRYDDGRFRLMMLDKQPDFGQGDRVRIDSRGQLLPP